VSLTHQLMTDAAVSALRVCQCRVQDEHQLAAWGAVGFKAVAGSTSRVKATISQMEREAHCVRAPR
jgi:hypothetical protein